MALRLPRLVLLPTVAAVALAFAPSALAGGPSVAFDGGTRAERAEVSRALAASSFDWSILPEQVTVHIRSGAPAEAIRDQVWLDPTLLDSGTFAWGIVQHEFAHQVDFQLLDDATRAQLTELLGATAWCWDDATLDHAAYGCERFASTLAWAFWPSRSNCLAPRSRGDESAAMAPKPFRALLARTLHRPYLRAMRRSR